MNDDITPCEQCEHREARNGTAEWVSELMAGLIIIAGMLFILALLAIERLGRCAP